MRQRICVIGSMFCLVAMIHAVLAHDPHPIVSPYVTKAPTIDGDLSDWDTSIFVRVTPQTGVFDGESDSTDDPNDLSFAFGAANDDRYLYMAVKITDDVLVLDTNRDPSDKDARAWGLMDLKEGSTTPADSTQHILGL